MFHYCSWAGLAFYVAHASDFSSQRRFLSKRDIGRLPNITWLVFMLLRFTYLGRQHTRKKRNVSLVLLARTAWALAQLAGYPETMSPSACLLPAYLATIPTLPTANRSPRNRGWTGKLEGDENPRRVQRQRDTPPDWPPHFEVLRTLFIGVRSHRVAECGADLVEPVKKQLINMLYLRGALPPGAIRFSDMPVHLLDRFLVRQQ